MAAAGPPKLGSSDSIRENWGDDFAASAVDFVTAIWTVGRFAGRDGAGAQSSSGSSRPSIGSGSSMVQENGTSCAAERVAVGNDGF